MSSALPAVMVREPTALAAIGAIGLELDRFDDWLDRCQFIIERGREMPAYPAALRDAARRIPGCQSKVWLDVSRVDGRMVLAGGSDAAIMSGLLALLIRVHSGRTPEEVLETDPVFLTRLGLLESLTHGRANGLLAADRRVRDAARAHVGQRP